MALNRKNRNQLKAPHKAEHHLVKEKNSSAREKPYVSTTALFKAAANSRVNKRSVPESAMLKISKLPALRPRSSRRKAGLGKSILANHPTSSPNLAPSRASTHPLVTHVNTTLANYRDSVTETSRIALNPVHDDLLQRLEDGSSDQCGIGLGELADEFQQAMNLSDTIGKSLGEHKVKVRFRDSQGGTTDGEVALANTVTRFEKILRDKQAELQNLWQQWDEVRQEISELGAEILDDSSFPTQFGLEVHPTTGKVAPRCSGPNDDIVRLRDTIRTVCENSRREVDKEAQEDAQNRKAKRDQWLDLLKKEL